MDIHRERELLERVARLEQKVEFLLRELRLEEKERAAPVRPDLSGVEDLLRRGNKLEAVRQYRERTGVGLAEALSAVEAMEREIKW